MSKFKKFKRWLQNFGDDVVEQLEEPSVGDDLLVDVGFKKPTLRQQGERMMAKGEQFVDKAVDQLQENRRQVDNLRRNTPANPSAAERRELQEAVNECSRFLDKYSRKIDHWVENTAKPTLKQAWKEFKQACNELLSWAKKTFDIKPNVARVHPHPAAQHPAREIHSERHATGHGKGAAGWAERTAKAAEIERQQYEDQKPHHGRSKPKRGS